MFLDVFFFLTKDVRKSLLGKMQLELRKSEFHVLISWVGNSFRNILMNTYSVPGTMTGLRDKKQRLSLCLKSSQCRGQIIIQVRGD